MDFTSQDIVFGYLLAGNSSFFPFKILAHSRAVVTMKYHSLVKDRPYDYNHFQSYVKPAIISNYRGIFAYFSSKTSQKDSIESEIAECNGLSTQITREKLYSISDQILRLFSSIVTDHDK